MISRKQKVEELLTDLHSLRRAVAFRMNGSAHGPRVTPAQWSALMRIEQRKGSTVKDVAETLGITSSAATQLVDGLVASGYLVREPRVEDRRSVILTLSKKSRGQVDRMKRHALQKFLKVFKVLSDAEFNQYIALNKKIVQGFMSENNQ